MKQKIDQVLGKVLILLFGIMCISILWQVFSRYFLDQPSSYTEELARYCLIWLGMLGAAYAAGQNMHLAITFLPDKLSGTNRKRLNVILNLLTIFFAITVFCIGGSRLVYITNILGQDSPALGVPLSFVYAILPISGILIITYKTLEIRKIRDMKGGNSGS